MKSRTSEASLPATRIRSISSGLFRTTAIGLIMLEFKADLALRIKGLSYGRYVGQRSPVKFPARPIRVPDHAKARRVLGLEAADTTLRSFDVCDYASNAGGGRPFRAPDPLLEPE